MDISTAATAVAAAARTEPSVGMTQAQTFQSLMQQAGSSGSGSRLSVAQSYHDEVAPPAASASSRAVAVPDELMSLAKTVNDELKAHRAETSALFDTGESSFEFMKPYRAQLEALVRMQDAVTNSTLVMKGIELSSSAAQQLFKMQG
jgi:hypothetical protein